MLEPICWKYCGTGFKIQKRNKRTMNSATFNKKRYTIITTTPQ